MRDTHKSNTCVLLLGTKGKGREFFLYLLFLCSLQLRITLTAGRRVCRRPVLLPLQPGHGLRSGAPSPIQGSVQQCALCVVVLCVHSLNLESLGSFQLLWRLTFLRSASQLFCKMHLRFGFDAIPWLDSGFSLAARKLHKWYFLLSSSHLGGTCQAVPVLMRSLWWRVVSVRFPQCD